MGLFLSQTDKQCLCVRRKSRPDQNVMFRIHTMSRGSDRLSEIAKTADTVIYCAGNDPMQVARECFDRRTIQLPPVQREALLRLSEERDDLIMLIVSG